MSKYFVMFFIVVFIGSIVGLGVLSRENADQTQEAPENSQQGDIKDLETDEAAQQQAIEVAKNYSPPPDVMCTMALTPATHDETGAEYTFPNGCIAPGWTAEQ